MLDFEVAPLLDADRMAAAELWNAVAQAGETLYRPIDADQFPFSGEGIHAFAAKADGKLIGWIHGAAKRRFLSGETAENTPAYLTAIVVDRQCRRQGVGHAMLSVLMGAFRGDGKRVLVCSGDNPVHLSWFVPGTPGHDHNNAPGVDEGCLGYPFLLHRGFHDDFHEIAMYMALKDYQWQESLTRMREELLAQGIRTGRYDLNLGDEYDEMCDRVGSEYWRNSLRSELAAWRENRPNSDPEFWPDGVCPKGPRTLLTATVNGHIVGFTGPVDRQKSGRGWFTGICTDPLYAGKGIASVLFNLLMKEFIAQGSVFCTLFTGRDNPAQRLYQRAGLQIVAHFAVLSIPLEGVKRYEHTYF
jgi:ribosomal protein S18 acetylase RimI-like enzyme